MTSPRSSLSNYARWIKPTAFFIIFLAIILTIIPIAAKILVQSELVKLGAADVYIDDININPFIGQVEVSEFVIRGNVGDGDEQDLVSIEFLRINVSLLSLLQKKIYVESLEINGVLILVEEVAPGEYKIGIPLVAEIEPNTDGELASESSFDWGVGISNTLLKNIHVTYQSPLLTSSLVIDLAELTQAKSWDADHKTNFTLAGSLNGAVFNITSTASPFIKHPETDFQLQLQEFDLAPLNPLLPSDIRGVEGRLTLDLDLRLNLKMPEIVHYQSSSSLLTSVDGMIKLEGIKFKTDKFDLKSLNTHWQGKINTKTSLNSFDTILDQDIEVTFSDLDIELVELPIAVSFESTTWKGTTTLDSSDIDNSLVVVSDLRSNKLSAHLINSSIQLFNVKELVFSEIGIEGLNNLSLKSVGFNGLNIAESDDANQILISSDRLLISDIQLANQNQLTINDINFGQLTATLDVDTKGEILLVDDILAALGMEEDRLPVEGGVGVEDVNGIEGVSGIEGNENDEDDDGFHLGINSIGIDKQSRFNFTDASIEPAFETYMVLEQFNIGPIDTTAIDVRTHLLMEGRIGEFSTLVATGELQLFAEKKSGLLKASISSLELPPVSPYAKDAIGYRLESGQLNSYINLSIEQNKLKGNNKVLLANLNIAPEDDEKIKQLATKISMPIELALSILKNKKGDVEIDMPIEGDLDDPQINVADIVTAAVAKAVRKGSLSYLKFALQPYGAAIMILEKTSKHLSEVRLAPIEFSPNSSVFDNDDKEYMSKIASILDKRPALRIRLCSISTSEDSVAYENAYMSAMMTKSNELSSSEKILSVEEKAAEENVKSISGVEKVKPELHLVEKHLADLGRLRAASIKNHLIEQYKVEPDRLFVCHPAIAKGDKQGSPRTDIKI